MKWVSLKYTLLYNEYEIHNYGLKNNKNKMKIR